MRLTSKVLGIVHSERTVVVMLHKHFSSWLGTFCNSISTITYCNQIVIWANLTSWHMSTICSPFLCWLSTSNFSSILTIFAKFSLELHYVMQICFSLILVTKANTASAMQLYHRCNQSIHITDGMTMMSLSAILQHKTDAAKDCLCQIALNQKLLYIIYARSH